MTPYYSHAGVTLFHGHVLDVLRELPWRGRFNYWYTTDHDCPEKREAIASAKTTKVALDKAFR